MPNGESVRSERVFGLAVDPIHIGSGASLLGRVDNTIVRDPVTQVPKIPGSSLAGVYRAYVAMQQDRYPACAGQGAMAGNDQQEGQHCSRVGECPVCTMFGYATNGAGGFAGLAGFSDAHIVLFPISTRLGPRWVTSPSSLRIDRTLPREDVAYSIEPGGARPQGEERQGRTPRRTRSEKKTRPPLNFGWLQIEVRDLRRETDGDRIAQEIRRAIDEIDGLPTLIDESIVIVSEKLLSHLVNSNLESRTSVAIDPATGAAESGALFTYEAIPRATVLSWELDFRNPGHFRTKGKTPSFDETIAWVRNGEELLAELGVGGMITRGMGRMRVLNPYNEITNAEA